jgi:hypothetical protein
MLAFTRLISSVPGADLGEVSELSDLMADREEVSEAVWTRLEGPQPAVLHPEDALHWVAVYRELVETIDRMLASARERVHASNGRGHGASPESREVQLLETRAEFFRRRLEWWSGHMIAGTDGALAEG